MGQIIGSVDEFQTYLFEDPENLEHQDLLSELAALEKSFADKYKSTIDQFEIGLKELYCMLFKNVNFEQSIRPTIRELLEKTLEEMGVVIMSTKNRQGQLSHHLCKRWADEKDSELIKLKIHVLLYADLEDDRMKNVRAETIVELCLHYLNYPNIPEMEIQLGELSPKAVLIILDNYDNRVCECTQLEELLRISLSTAFQPLLVIISGSNNNALLEEIVNGYKITIDYW